MELIELSDAKTQLAELVARAERGEVIVITRGTRPVAELAPVGRHQPSLMMNRSAAIDALLAFSPITVNGAPVAELVRTGRE
jgi:prevent-host-death family protein